MYISHMGVLFLMLSVIADCGAVQQQIYIEEIF